MKSRYTTGTTSIPSSASPTSLQPQFASFAHIAEQPSPEMTLPSSQASLGSFSPSPQGEVQPVVPTQTGSERQSALQPSPPNVLWSSHDSAPSFTPSPQVVLWHAWPGVGHAYPGSR